ncbi:hypothetical protein JQ634_04600 [Bradyrhizobium sp. AUGA SZCCT0240]|jgi:hypothetical protein|uniref:hypothetical protein n=1 Tax=unclassified Bradyrhizobium TaxID=2631580 RepID=UPI001BA7A204|nr:MULTISPECIES: hypothetical protein [unclassified Bradyrhizobium]MBR1188648.1 hypothetical protein [Bradyrhizobium sp. AUGA SZCCT0160]MBR1195064.1 hypothetical protein [Bradyrhizobium sp. AUGA SZCCT0158]MBR1245013.1 hypothetical protein [Bradyrhizobium sp. AUGA SZCCT0274]MBR1251593.1 hypothetical protein [Bradyrhizobium sp. AUGA SZCCT0169]MBR1252975.1 hypothetical protein [Bradyrhizobium sp. AUGA SZCCT0240]
MGDIRLLRVALAATVVAGLGCGLVQPASAQSLTDRFKGLFGGKSDEPAPAPGAAPKAEEDIGDLTCPEVRVRAGASTYAVAAPGKQPVGNDLRFQATIGKTARECSLNGGVITARIGIQGRVIAGPAGAPSSVQVPLRVAVVQGGISEKTIATKAYQTTVSMTETGSEPFTLVAEDLVYPVPAPGTSDNYIFYIGFDPQALKPERPAPRKKAAPTQ